MIKPTATHPKMSSPDHSNENGVPRPETQLPNVQTPPHPGPRVPSSNFIEHLPAVARNSSNFREAFAPILPLEDDNGSEKHPENTDEVEAFENLLKELESEDEVEDEKEEEDTKLASSKNVPDDLLQTNVSQGLTEAEVKNRRSTYGLNQLKEHKPSHIKHFLMFFVGPIQFVMEVSLILQSHGLVASYRLEIYQGALVLAALNRDWVDLGVMVGLLLLNAGVGFIQDYSAGNVVKVSQHSLQVTTELAPNFYRR